MRTVRLLSLSLLLATLAAGTARATVEVAGLVPGDAHALIETVDGAGLRQMLLDSRFWTALEQTEAFRQWRASEKYQEMRQRIDELLARLKMPQDEALRTYLGGRTGIILLGPDPKKPDGVLLTETTNALAERFVKATGGVEVKRHRDVAIYEVRNEKKTDRLAFAANVLLVSGSNTDVLERVLDVLTGAGSPLGADGRFRQATQGLPDGWRARAYAAVVPPRQCPGAIAMYPQDKGRIHFEWRHVSEPVDTSATQPVALAGPGVLPDRAVAAMSSAFHPRAIWNLVKAKLAKVPDGDEKARKAEMFIRGWFPGQTTDAILGGLGPEASAALLKGDDASAPGLLAMVKLTAGGRPVAEALKNGLAAKAMILGALGQNNENAPRLSVREEAYGQASLVIIEAPGALDKVLGADWARDIALTVAVTNDWLIVGTTPTGVKQALDTADGKATSLKAGLTQAGEKVPAQPVTHWGVVQPASGADIVLAWAERLVGKQRVDNARKMVNLAELMRLVKRMVWERTDEPTVIRGTVDIQAVD